MIISWNVRELNKGARNREVSSHLSKIHPYIDILVETRVKERHKENIRKVIGNNWIYIDNYNDHVNGRIWLMWNSKNVDIKRRSSTNQLIHCGVYDVVGNFKHWITYVYTSNRLDKRRMLWQDIEKIHNNQMGLGVLWGISTLC